MKREISGCETGAKETLLLWQKLGLRFEAQISNRWYRVFNVQNHFNSGYFVDMKFRIKK